MGFQSRVPFRASHRASSKMVVMVSVEFGEVYSSLCPMELKPLFTHSEEQGITSHELFR